MFSFFQKKVEKVEDIEDIEEDEDVDVDVGEEKVEYTDIIFDNPIAINHNISYYLKDSNKICRFLSSWCFNRKIDQQHKNKIKEEIKSQSNHHLMGSIQIIRDKMNQIRVINGQHRLKAIEEIIREDLDNTFEMKILFECYDLEIQDITNPNEEEEEEIEKIFKTANKSLNMNPEEDHDIFCKKLIQLLCKDPVLGKGIIEISKSEKATKGKILKKEMFEMLKENLIVKGTVDQIFLRIKEMNKKISLMENKQLFGRDKPAKDRLRKLTYAQELGFFLNFDDYYAKPEKWLKNI
jgi:hypothetical protein